MTTQERYERYNEVTFEAYIKAAIDYALARYRKQQNRPKTKFTSQTCPIIGRQGSARN